MENIKAVKTEYRGIVFDSKSEAIYARHLDLITIRSNGEIKIFWEYHPVRFKIGSYCPDFCIQFWFSGDTPFGIFSGEYTLVEYKPLPPTKTYTEKAAKYFKRIVDKDVFYCVDNMIICSGSFFNETNIQIIELYRDKNKNIDGCTDHGSNSFFFNKDHIKEAAEYRFDLEHQKV